MANPNSQDGWLMRIVNAAQENHFGLRGLIRGIERALRYFAEAAY
ncbi:hypothetical protein [Ktedonospora formicarum]|nr:hypothetical protein [Ktedonospora formicarum]